MQRQRGQRQEQSLAPRHRDSYSLRVRGGAEKTLWDEGVGRAQKSISEDSSLSTGWGPLVAAGAMGL